MEKVRTRIKVVYGPMPSREIIKNYDVVTWGTKDGDRILWMEFPDKSRTYIMLFRVISFTTSELCPACGHPVHDPKCERGQS